MKTFRIEAYGYGGELVLGKCNPAFVAHWQPILEEEGDGELLELVLDLESFDDEPEDALVDPESPILPFEDGVVKPWHDFDDIEHHSGIFADSSFRIVEIDDDGNEVNGGFDQTFNVSDFRTLGCREAYHENVDENPESENKNYVPVLSCFSSEKGSFWTAIFNAENFDPNMLAFVTLESNLAEMVESVFYNFEQLEIEHDGSTTGKGFYASVGWMNTQWHDSSFTYLEDALQEWKDELGTED